MSFSKKVVPIQSFGLTPRQILLELQDFLESSIPDPGKTPLMQKYSQPRRV
jgi:hypothetical protein